MSLPDWLPGLFEAIDRQDAEAFADYLAPGVNFRFGNAPAVQGRAAAQEVVAGFFGAIAGLRHELEEGWSSGDAVICRGNVTYTRLDGSQLRVPFANILKLSVGKISDYLIYVDASALFAA